MPGGQLTVFLGAAPGVGKTYTMLEQGKHLAAEGKKVLVAIVETHGRRGTAAMIDGLEVLPRKVVTYRGVQLTDMDVDAVIAAHPDVALVDELAHTNAPGMKNHKRYQDVQEILDAGIDVISTVNIQHIESLNDVVEEITSVPQRETVPDKVLRQADTVEVVDLAPQALRNRLSAGDVYPAERIDAALSNYFRLGNLTALRELALLWLADEVDSALRNYRSEHGISGTWETRERVVVALTGGPEGETLVRRGARIAARSKGGELLAVHVVAPDGLQSPDRLNIPSQRKLVEELGGSYHQVVGEDIPRSLVEFARAVNATQLVVGVSRRSGLSQALFGPSIGSTVVRESGKIDVHMVTHEAAARHLRLPRITSSLTRARRIAAYALSCVAVPLLTALFYSLGRTDSVLFHALTFQALVVIVAMVGGFGPAVFAALLSSLSLNFFFIDPLYTVTIAEHRNIVALIMYVIVGFLVSIVVSRAARQTRTAQRAAGESELLAAVSGSVLRGQDAIQAILDRIYESFGAELVRLIENNGTVHYAGDTDSVDESSQHVYPLGEGRATVEIFGEDLPASERRLLSVLLTQLELALEHNDLTQTANEIAPLEASERVRSAILAALSHDLRRPLASATAAITGLRYSGVELTAHDRDELLTTADESLEALGKLINDLLDMSRLETGFLAITTSPVEVAEVVVPALDELHLGPADVELSLDAHVPPVSADGVLLQRVLVNLLLNAQRHSPEGSRVRIASSSFGDSVEIRVIDHGVGVPDERMENIFLPFQRHGDTDNSTGLGLGLALARGFVEGMGGTLQGEHTPGGGLTMVVALHAWESPSSQRDEATSPEGTVDAEQGPDQETPVFVEES